MASVEVGGARHLLLYDGSCGLCHRLVRFVLRRDPAGIVCFAALQGERAAVELARHGVVSRLDTFYLIEDFAGAAPRVWQKGRGALALFRLLGWPWRALMVFWPLPDFVLDVAYGLVARLRYRVFGRRDVCDLPAPGERARFL